MCIRDSGGIGALATCVDIAATDVDAMVAFAQVKEMDLVAVSYTHLVPAGRAFFPPGYLHLRPGVSVLSCGRRRICRNRVGAGRCHCAHGEWKLFPFSLHPGGVSKSMAVLFGSGPELCEDYGGFMGGSPCATGDGIRSGHPHFKPGSL